MSKYGDDVRITLDGEVLHQQIDDEIVLLHFASDSFYGLDEVGGRMWSLLKEHGALPPVVAAIVDEYDVNAATAREDLERLIDDLASAGLVSVEG